jgi:hypothetical protein
VRRAFLLLGLVALPAVASAQTSQFGVRGLGMPGRALSARAFSTGGAFAMFDVESSVNPASLGRATALSAGFNVLQDWRDVENPAGSASTRETRFPHLTVSGPARVLPAVLGLSYSMYANRDFTLASVDTAVLRGTLVPVTDTLASRGGLSDLRLAGAYRLSDAWIVGAGFHVITGSNRLRARRTFSDTAYQVSTESTELSFAGVGLSLGLIRNFGPRFSVAGSVRYDGKLNVDRDSTDIGTVDLPYSFGVGVRWRAQPKIELASQVTVKTWSGANSDLLAQRGNGAQNTVEASLGMEFSNPRRPTQTPIRLGARYGTLPFTLVPGEQPHEFGLSIGSGLHLAQERAGFDLGLEHVWRSEGVYSERAFLLALSVTIRP